jgi:peptidoglycan glycosyltransferase
MNRPLRRLSIIVTAMFLAIMASTTFIQFFQANSLNNHGRNVRALYREYGRNRGPIVAENGQILVESIPVESPFRYMRTFSGGDPEAAAMWAPVTGFFSIANGATGIERAENDWLNGTASAMWVNRLRNIFAGEDTRGASVEVTAIPAVQEAAWNALGDQRGAVIALDPSTGAILAMVSNPSFDPNELAVHSTGQAASRFQELVATDHDPLINRNIGTLYPPGSTFKLIPAAAAFENGLILPNQLIPAPATYTLPGTSHALRNFGGARCSPTDELTIAEAMIISCNTAFAMLGVELGGDLLRTEAERWGFNSAFNIPMGTAVSAFPSGANFTPDRQALAGIGQGDVTTTPLQMAVMTAAIANNGVIMQPYLVETVRDAHLDVLFSASPHVLRQAVTANTAIELQNMMVATVERGTGTAAQIPGVSVAGKTGTAQTAPGVAPHAWFVAFAPADNPQVAVAVVVENGGNMASEATGGRVAAPIARAVIQAVLNQ